MKKELTAAKKAGRTAEIEYQVKEIRGNIQGKIEVLHEMIREPGGITDRALTLEVGALSAAIKHLNRTIDKLKELQP